jgi:hypothetical protein
MQHGAHSYTPQLRIKQCTKRIIIPSRPSSGFHTYTKHAIAVQAQGLQYYIRRVAMHDTSSIALQALIDKLLRVPEILLL